MGESGQTTHRTGDRKLCLCCPSSAKTSTSWGMATTCRRPYSLPDMAHNVVAQLSCWPQEQGQRTPCWEPHGGTQPEDMGTPSCVFISGFLPGNQESGIASMAQKALLGDTIPADSWKNLGVPRSAGTNSGPPPRSWCPNAGVCAGCRGPEITHSRSGKATWPWRWPQERPRGFVTVEVPSSLFSTPASRESHIHTD